MRLTGTEGLPGHVKCPGFTPSDHGAGIVHLGLGAFHKAHQAAYTDTALAHSGGDWRITGVSLRSLEPAAQLAPQNGLYTLIEHSAKGSSARIIGSIADAYALGPDRAAVLEALTAPATRIVSITVTEKGYGLDRSTGGVDTSHPAIAHDLKDPEEPVGVAGLLVWALEARHAAGVPPFTVLCCDNLPENGRLLRGLLVDFARRAMPEIAEHIANDVAFPSTMVDRITPAATEATLAVAAEMTGREDAAAIETEAFSQWVIEDHFPTGRPDWESAGAMFVSDVKPYEEMKLRMLNGAHSMLAYAGFIAGCTHVSDVMADPVLSRLVRRHLSAAAATLPQLAGVDFDQYADALVARFSNPHLRHQTYQIAMDGTEKLPQRILAPAVDAQAAGQPLAPFALAVAAWMRYVLGETDTGVPYAIRDPREEELTQLTRDRAAGDIVANLVALPGFFPSVLAKDSRFLQMVSARLGIMLDHGMRRALDAE
ncbi:mannitol dehydrogenase family protein [Sulfitobacter pseudonitzschiae]|uniref:Mannitol dehydrogenase family protein n=1 Tax=Pseudosulfitobacter pseudonitzschiae TaxID=1402135 RepID=A0A9Q2P5E1_9RHOB|nr:mannitol dehydrogenase family protein [Pseudosulfitobacter pseudonitzschiae]MBM2294085.1 mannitol dehydrogenase family protein [Pseudosulfitobacter pseudonitzschiae]MBM2299009.1 mannitol dehydrogenase family protein [Pseudosulfitobacter pseudonitzschiae]MBM2303917.1 mannitol dehydrogenase family protein [Pseudosulfitobacter pseudonitzschiae]MBM2313698.1 mannitol dehydrogenase family protein [Pseudosulfitobacter pseudonitzschiae]MBM2318613.1 mannitol dehydrogenase family protein [Pseudosulfi